MFEEIINFFKKLRNKKEEQTKGAAKERLHLVLTQDRANISADFLSLMKQEIIEVIKKYIDIDENAIDVRLTNQAKDDGTVGSPTLYANIPIISVKEDITGVSNARPETEEGSTILDEIIEKHVENSIANDDVDTEGEKEEEQNDVEADANSCPIPEENVEPKEEGTNEQ